MNTMPATETIFTNGDNYFDALFHDIDNAKTSIDLETYIFATDDLGNKLVAALSNAAKRGVCVRVHVDGVGSRYWSGSNSHELDEAGVKTRIFHPFPWNFWHWSHSIVRMPHLLKFIYLLININKRNHRKFCIIDQNIVYVGSFNITKSHLNKNHGGESWRDTAIRITGGDITTLQQAFDTTWQYSYVQRRLQQYFTPVIDTIFRLNDTRKRRRRLHKNLLRRIATSKNRIWITNAYFIPDNYLLVKLRKAARRGIDVRILLPHKSDVMMMPWASASFYENLLKAGVRIFEYLPSMLHAKVLIIDDWMTVGSSNLNYRSLLHDLEIDVVVSTSNAKHILEKQFLADITAAKEITLADWEWRPWYKRWVGHMLLYLKYLI